MTIVTCYPMYDRVDVTNLKFLLSDSSLTVINFQSEMTDENGVTTIVFEVSQSLGQTAKDKIEKALSNCYIKYS